MINHIDIVSIPVSDQQISKDFYLDKLGFELVRENPMGPDQTWVQLSPPGADTSITLVTWFDIMPPGSAHRLVVDTDNVAEARSQLIKNGVDLSKIQVAPWGRFATFCDPDRNGWILQQSV